MRAYQSCIDSIVEKGRNPVPDKVKFTTWTLRYNKMLWVTVDALGEHWTGREDRPCGQCGKGGQEERRGGYVFDAVRIVSSGELTCNNGASRRSAVGGSARVV